jgi:hypothetical protein
MMISQLMPSPFQVLEPALQLLKALTVLMKRSHSPSLARTIARTVNPRRAYDRLAILRSNGLINIHSSSSSLLWARAKSFCI